MKIWKSRKFKRCENFDIFLAGGVKSLKGNYRGIEVFLWRLGVERNGQSGFDDLRGKMI